MHSSSLRVFALSSFFSLTFSICPTLAQNFESPYAQHTEQAGAPPSLQPLPRQKAVLFVTTTQNLDGYAVAEYLGVVRGVTVRQPTMGQNFMAGVQGMMNPNIDAYAEMCDQAREQSLQRLIKHAQDIGANAVVGLRYDSSPISTTTFETEVLAYGTAVIVRPLH